MKPYCTWLNVVGSIMYYYMFPFKDAAGSGVGVSVHLKHGKIQHYGIRGNFDVKYVLGSKGPGSNLLIVTDEKELKLLNSLNIHQDTIKWAFEDGI